jgi:DNA-binding transcriptional ArsR family regulator
MGGVSASADVFRAVADPTRRALLELLRQSARSVHELAQPFRMSQPAISQHLRILRKARLVLGRQVGRQRLYRLNPKPLDDLYAWASKFKVPNDPAGHVWALGQGSSEHGALSPPQEPTARITKSKAMRRMNRKRG